MRGEVKKGIVLAIIIMLFVMNFLSVEAEHSLCVNKNQDASTYCEKTTGSGKKWTFLAYLDGDMSDIESSILFYINRMELIGSNSDVNIVVQADDCGMWNNQTRRYYIIHDDDPNVIASPLADNDTSEKNMGNPQTLIDFVCWAIGKYPAENYCLTMFDHGDGWRGLCSDITNNGSYLHMSDFKEAMGEVSNHLGKKLDVLILDACTMGMIEVFYPIKDYVNICISSEIPTSYHDMYYERILENLTDQPLLSPPDFSQKIVDSLYPSYNNGITTHIYFGVYMDKIEVLTEAVDELAKALENNMPPDFMIKELNTYSFCWDGYQTGSQPHDLLRFAEKISESAYNNNIKNKANQVMEIINESVIRPHEGNDSYIDPRLNGIAIYFPSKEKDFESAYKEQEFANNTQWDEFLLGYLNLAKQITHQTILFKLFAMIDLRLTKIIENFRSLIAYVINYIKQKHNITIN